MHTLPQLQYPYDALEPFIDETTMRIHHEKHHAAYVKNLNDALAGNDALLSLPIETLIANLSQVPENVRTKVRNNGGGHYNHSLFWEVMGPGGDEPTGKLADAITTSFGSFASFKEKFSTAGIGRFGSGWVWLVVDGLSLTIIDTQNQDHPIMEGKKTILGLDVWEHAYYLTYQNRRADYIAAWWHVVNWNAVEEQFARAIT